MDIYAKPGTKVRFLNVNGYEQERAVAAEVLSTSDVYTVQTLQIGNFSTNLILVEYPRKRFNSVMFETVGEYDRFEHWSDTDHSYVAR